MGSPYFIGIDLAWSARNKSGLAVLQWDGQIASLKEGSPALAITNADIVDFVRPLVTSETLIVAVDAPLAVPNETGLRPSERALNTIFGRFHAGAYPSNRKRLEDRNGGTVRGEEIVRLLDGLGIRHAAQITARQPARQMFEVYPHPAMITLFKLNKVLKYKARHTPATRREAFRAYQAHLGSLRAAQPALSLPDALLSEGYLAQVAQSSSDLKALEDKLDAVFCAYSALYYWYYGDERCQIFCDEEKQYEKGYIVVPIDECKRP